MKVAVILYGLPDFTTKLQQDLDEKRVVLAGCVIFENSPGWQCVGCGHRWGRIELLEDDDGSINILHV